MQNEETGTLLLPSAIDANQTADAPHLPILKPDNSAAFVRRAPSREEGAEIARRGWELYEQSIRAHVEPQHTGKFMSIDIDSGEYAISDDPHGAAHQLIAKNFHARLYGLRVGSRAMYRSGFLRRVG